MAKPASPRYSEIHASIESKCLLHKFIGREWNSYHGNSSQIVDGHSTIQSLNDAIFTINQRQGLKHTHTARLRKEKQRYCIINYCRKYRKHKFKNRSKSTNNTQISSANKDSLIPKILFTVTPSRTTKKKKAISCTIILY